VDGAPLLVSVPAEAVLPMVATIKLLTTATAKSMQHFDVPT
jgi:hypothetical protein